MADEAEDSYVRIRAWRQGDYALDVGGHLFADISEDPEERFQVSEKVSDTVGLIVISQTCDILNAGGGEFITACPLVAMPDDEIKRLEKGYRPSIVQIENPPADNVFADISRPMSVSKRLLAKWNRVDGFRSDATRRRFALSLERKFGRFAFPDDIDAAMKKFTTRVLKRHDKPESELGKIYQSIREIRLRCAPSWQAQQKKIAFLFIWHEASRRLMPDEKIAGEISDELDKITLPAGYSWDDPKFILAAGGDFTADDIYESHALDFEFLCA